MLQGRYCVLLLLGQAIAFAPVAAAESESQSAPAIAYPAWSTVPTHNQQQAVPKPPSGPYMSTGLSSGHQKLPGRGRPRLAPQSSAPFDSSMPWPMRRVAPQRWMPEGGYNYAPPVSGPPIQRQVQRQTPAGGPVYRAPMPAFGYSPRSNYYPPRPAPTRGAAQGPFSAPYGTR